MRRLARAGVKLNVTALMTLDQVREVSAALAESPASLCLRICRAHCRHRAGPCSPHGRGGGTSPTFSQPGTHLGQPPGTVEHFPGRCRGVPHHYRHQRHPEEAVLVGKDLHDYSLDTVKMFYNDAQQAGYQL